MSLFICMRPDCNNVENTNLVTAKLGVDPKYPNMYRTEMMGNGKHKEGIMMLCCECNCGMSHGEFEYSKATEEEKALAKTSKYNMITPYDHGDNIIKDEKAPHGYRLKTEQEIKSNRRSLHKVYGLLAVTGLSLGNFFKSESDNVAYTKSEELTNKLLFKAEIKRRIKSLNKEIQISKDVYRLSELKHQLLEAKNLYKTS